MIFIAYLDEYKIIDMNKILQVKKTLEQWVIIPLDKNINKLSLNKFFKINEYQGLNLNQEKTCGILFVGLEIYNEADTQKLVFYYK